MLGQREQLGGLSGQLVGETLWVRAGAKGSGVARLGSGAQACESAVALQGVGGRPAGSGAPALVALDVAPGARRRAEIPDAQRELAD